jgi:hypothetical protein
LLTIYIRDRIGGSYKKPEKEFKEEMYFDKLKKRKNGGKLKKAD